MIVLSQNITYFVIKGLSLYHQLTAAANGTKQIKMNFKNINALVNSTAWNKFRDVEGRDFTESEMITILDYVNERTEHDAHWNDELTLIFEAVELLN